MCDYALPKALSRTIPFNYLSKIVFHDCQQVLSLSLFLIYFLVLMEWAAVKSLFFIELTNEPCIN